MVDGTQPALVLGAGGLLGSALVKALNHQGTPTQCWGRDNINLAEPKEIAARIAASGAMRIFNCAAHTDLEAAELDPTLDRAVNAELPRVIAATCADLGILLIHFSSTGCYGDWKEGPYTEADLPRPLSKHHQAKLAGERAISSVGCHHIIFRLGWLYGGTPQQPKNFVWKRIVEAMGKTEMLSDDTQRGCPTFVGDVGKQVLAAVDAGLVGTFNAVAGGFASRSEYVRAIVTAAGLPCEVHPGPRFIRKAPVSANETAVNARLQAEGLDLMPAWRDSIEIYVASLLRENAQIRAT